MFFEKIVTAPADPILGLTEEFKNDPRPNKINLGVGIYKTNEGNTPILKCVKKAEEIIYKTETTKSYLPIVGSPEYGQLVRELIFGADSDVIKSNRARTCQAPGGTGALRIGADFLKQQDVTKKVWISDPTWANHFQVFGKAGLETAKYPYYNKETNGLDFEGMKNTLKTASAGDVVVVHACCHNPTGIDPTPAQWEELAKLFAELKLIPFFDFAYQGFGNGIDEDAAGIRTFLKYNNEILISSSFSKNFGLYNERIGALTIVSENSEVADRVFSQMKIAVRANISNPPAHGALIVTTVLSNPELKALWIEEVKEMRDRIKEMRDLFVAKLQALGVSTDFSFIAEQYGMFSFSGLNKDQVARLKEEFGIYIVGSGRISVAGITTSNIDPLCEAIAKVL
jgi:aspartate/tyrosine/aromatic aminotransferase